MFLKNQKQVKYINKWYTSILSVKIKNSHTCSLNEFHAQETWNISHKAHTEQINEIYNK